MPLGKDKLNTIAFLIAKALIIWWIDDFMSWWNCFSNNVLREYNEIKEEIKNPLWNTLLKSNRNLLCVSFVRKILQTKVEV